MSRCSARSSTAAVRARSRRPGRPTTCLSNATSGARHADDRPRARADGDRDALEERRIVTVTGPGGVGKTRLAVEAARALADHYAGGVHVVWLASVADAADVPAALAAAVQPVAQPGEPAKSALIRRLGGTHALLVIDNLEHVLAAAPLLADLVATCPRLRILATSRESLRAERVVPVAPLTAPDAAMLFVERARDRRPEFVLTDWQTARRSPRAVPPDSTASHWPWSCSRADRPAHRRAARRPP